MKSGSGKRCRRGISLPRLFEMFPDDAAEEAWFVKRRWPDGLRCACREGDHVAAKESQPQMPHRCHDCKKHFSVKTNSVMHASKIGCRKRAIAMYLPTANLEGVSSMKLHRDLGIDQKSAWRMIHRILGSRAGSSDFFAGSEEFDEVYMGGKDRNRHEREVQSGRDSKGRHPVHGA